MPFPYITATKFKDESIRYSQTLKPDTVYSLVAISLDEKLVQLFHQQTQSSFAAVFPSDELRCNVMQNNLSKCLL